MGRLRIIQGGRKAHPFHLTADERAAIEWEIERLIMSLDLADGDPDLEPEEDTDAAHDDGCGPIAINGRVVWGSRDDEPYRNVPHPRYGIDQSRGPINHAGAVAAYLDQQGGR
jgi:hypothetical protein